MRVAQTSFLSSLSTTSCCKALGLFGGEFGGFLGDLTSEYKLSHLQLKRQLLVAYTLFTRY